MEAKILPACLHEGWCLLICRKVLWGKRSSLAPLSNENDIDVRFLYAFMYL